MNKETTLQIGAVTNRHERCSYCNENAKEVGELTKVEHNPFILRACQECLNTIMPVLKLLHKEDTES